ncbi:MAG: hypothetical protein ACRDWD_04815 [Acidimicrobiia bacterium]
MVIGLSAAASLALWSPAAVEELREQPGNIEQIARFFVDEGGGPPAGWWNGAGLLAAEYRWGADWLWGSDLVQPLTGTARPASLWWLMVAVAVLAVGGVAAYRSRSSSDLRLVGLMAVMNLTAAAALSRVVGPLISYLFLWRVVVAVFSVLAACWAVTHWLDLRHRPRVTIACLVLFAVALLFTAGGLTWRVLDYPQDVSPLEPIVDEMADDLTNGQSAETAVLLRPGGGGLDGLAGGLFNELDRRGVNVKADPADAFVVGNSRTADLNSVASVWYVAEESQSLSLVADYPEAEVLTTHTPLTPSEARELTQLQRSAAHALVRAGRGDLTDYLSHPLAPFALAEIKGLIPDDLERLTTLNDKVARSGECHCGVVAFRPDVAPTIDVQSGRFP